MKQLVLLMVISLTVSLVSCDNQNFKCDNQNDNVDSTAVVNSKKQAEYTINYLLAPNNGYLIHTIPIK